MNYIFLNFNGTLKGNSVKGVCIYLYIYTIYTDPLYTIPFKFAIKIKKDVIHFIFLLI